MTGKPAYTPHSILFLLDESLVPAVSEALKLVGYRTESVQSVFGLKGVADPDVIEWCRRNQAVWIHSDDRARKEHRVQLQTSGIRTIWLYRERGRMAGREQLRILAFVLPQFLHKLSESPAIRHYRASARNDLSRPSLRPGAP